MKKIIYEKHHPLIYSAEAKKLYKIPHLHNEIEIIYVLEGEGETLIDNNIFKIKKGDFAISFPNQVHSYNATEGKYIVSIISPNIFYNMKEILFKSVPRDNLITGEGNEKIAELIISATKSDLKYDELVRTGIFCQVFGLMLEKMELVKKVGGENTTVKEILNFCTLNFRENISLDGLAEELHINKYHISYIFNKKLNLKFNTYINSLRINSACDDLIDTDKKISEISEEVGFGSIRSFNRAFLELKGMTPLEYRCHIQGQERQK